MKHHILVLLTRHRAEPVCNSDSVVFVTVSAPTVTKTITMPLEKVLDVTGVESVPAASQMPISKDLTATSTIYVTFTEIISIVSVTPTLFASGPAPTSTNENTIYAAADNGPYYFAEQDGTLVWLDNKSPPAGVSFLTSTAFVTLEPVPYSVPPSPEEDSVSTAEGSKISTSYSTISLYSVSTAYQTIAVTSTIPVPAASPKVFVGLGSSGWNTSFTTTPQVDENKKAENNTLNPILRQTGVAEKIDDHPETSTADPAPTLSANATMKVEARQVGTWVFATIDGVRVSWINNYDGTEPSPTPPINSWIDIQNSPLPVTPTSANTAEVPVNENIVKTGICPNPLGYRRGLT